MYDAPNFSQYTREELIDALTNIDSDSFPERTRQIIRLLKEQHGMSDTDISQIDTEKSDALASTILSLVVWIPVC